MKRSRVRGSGFAAVVGGRRWREAEAGTVLKEWARSGLGLEEFARRHGLRPQRLRRWSERLRQGRVPTFHPVELCLDGSATLEPSSPRGGVELMLPGGRRIAVSRGFDVELLSRLVHVVESWPC